MRNLGRVCTPCSVMLIGRQNNNDFRMNLEERQLSRQRNEIKVRMKVFHELSGPQIYVSLVLVKITVNVVTAR